MKMVCRGFWFTLMLLAFWRPVAADDIDLFVRASPTANAPSLLLVIDNAANFSSASEVRCQIDGVFTALDKTVGGIEQCALHAVIKSLTPDSVNVGVMVYNSNGVVDHLGEPCVTVVASRPGGCLVYPMTSMTEENKLKLLEWIASWKTSGGGPGYIKANSQATGGVMQEAWAYLEGRTGLSGRAYKDLKLPEACNTYVVFIGNSFGPAGQPGDQTGDKGPRDALEGKNPTPTMNASPVATPEQRAIINKTITTSCGTATLGAPHEGKGFYGDEWARYLNAAGYTTYTIGVLGDKCQPEYSGVLSSMAAVGGGKYFPTYDFDDLVTALQSVLSEMLSVNSVFASVSLPISVNTEGTYLNQVYIGMFRPDKKTLPRWAGNLKQYRLGKVDGELKLVDARDPGDSAISSSGTGFLSACALSYWTPTIDDEYWELLVERNCEGHPAKSNTPDGNIVEKGAQGYVLRDSLVAKRNLKTCSTAACLALADFNTDNAAITAALLGDADTTSLINWARGLNNKGDEFGAADVMRPSAHGDVVHSRPVAINYAANDEDPPEVVVFYGSNDGVLRAINGNREADIVTEGGNVKAGQELWGFIAPEFFPYVKRLRENFPVISYKGIELIDPPIENEPKPYGFDGAITAHTEAGEAWIYGTMRRGGRMVYAFDVTDITNNTGSPTIKWRFGCPNLGDDEGCPVPGATDIGQTWSSPRVLKTAGYKDGDFLKPMLIMGGGYDRCEDEDPHGCPVDPKGNRIFVLDADSGALLSNTMTTDRPVIGDIFVVAGAEGVAKWAYAADLGGNIYRISATDANTPLSDEPPENWISTKIASLGCGETADPCPPRNRKFMFAPDIVEQAGVYHLLIGSGDREKPLHKDDYPSAYGTTNYFFMIRDLPTDAEWLKPEEAACGDDVICMKSLLVISGAATPSAADLAKFGKGWALKLGEGEQVVTSAITVFGGTTFSTHTPADPFAADAGVCTTDLGTARVYNVRYANAAASKPGVKSRSEVIAGGGLPPSPVAGLVKLDDGTIVPFIIGADGASPLEGGEPIAPALTTLPKSITYWYIEK